MKRIRSRLDRGRSGNRRHIRDHRAVYPVSRLSTRFCVADPEASVFHRHFADRNVSSVSGSASWIEGIGRPRGEPSFNPDVIDCAYAVSDKSVCAAAMCFRSTLAANVGGSTGTSMWAAAHIIRAMADRGEKGSVVALLCYNPVSVIEAPSSMTRGLLSEGSTLAGKWMRSGGSSKAEHLAQSPGCDAQTIPPRPTVCERRCSRLPFVNGDVRLLRPDADSRRRSALRGFACRGHRGRVSPHSRLLSLQTIHLGRCA